MARYILQPYTTPKSRHTCPSCGHKQEFKYYIDSRTNEVLPEQFGLCNRVSCGYHLSPYDDSTGMSYSEQVYQKGREEARNNLDYQPSFKTAPPPPPIVPIPAEVVAKSMSHYEHNDFYRLLCTRIGVGEANRIVSQFGIGTSTFYPGACVFWQYDQKGQVRGGQVVKFDETGHTAYAPDGHGELKRCTNWVHWAMVGRHKQLGQALPEWLQAYIDAHVFSPCLFGLQQLAATPAHLPVALVEAPKTAALCAAYFPNFIWMATGSLQQLNRERLAPLRGRKIVLFPDMSPTGSAYADWKDRAERLNAQGFSITLNDYEQKADPQQRANKWDMADVILEQYAGYPPSWD